MSFEKHHIVAPYLAIYEAGHSGFKSKSDLYETLARVLQEKVQHYEEQEALQETKIEDPFPIMYKTLKNAAGRGDWEAVETLSKAIQRINFNY